VALGGRLLQRPNLLLRRGAFVSGGLHLLVLLSLIVVMPQSRPPEPPEPPAVEMQFTGPPAASQKADQATPDPRPPAPVPNPAPPSPTPPEKLPVEEAPPPPPPPPPAPPPPEAAPAPLPPLPLPPKLQAPSPEPVRAPPPLPSPPAPSHTVSPPTPMPTPVPALPRITLPSHLTQPNQTKNAVPDTHSLMATLEKLRADQAQTHPPRARANPAQGGAPSRGRDITASLSAGEQHAIGNAVRRCYAEDTAARDYAQFQAHLTVTVDATGEARAVEFSGADAQRMAADPSFRALAERARAAVMSPVCARLPLPPAQLGQVHQIKFVFRP
jgi:hypothetical protein